MEFIKRETGSFFIFFLLIGVNLFIWVIYGLPFEPLVYGLLLDTVFFALLEAYRGFHFYQTKKRLEKAAETDCIDFDSLPLKDEPLGNEYRQLLENQEKRFQRLAGEYESSMTDMKEYYSMWTHQIKTPIAGIKLLISEETVDKAAVKRELYRVEQYVDTTLWYQRFQKGNHDLLIKEYPLEELLKEVIKRNAPILLRQDLKLTLELKDCPALTDKKWLEFIVEQLLSNAVKYTKNGEIRISVRDFEERTEIVIKDTGIGIRPEDIPRIFEWGYTGWNGRENKKSTGIGLALSKRAADLLGHEIVIASELGKGTEAVVGISKEKVDLKE